MSDVAKLKKENKKLKSLLKDAVELLNKYKDVIEQVRAPGVKPVEKKKKKEPGKKKKKSAARGD